MISVIIINKSIIVIIIIITIIVIIIIIIYIYCFITSALFQFKQWKTSFEKPIYCV